MKFLIILFALCSSFQVNAQNVAVTLVDGTVLTCANSTQLPAACRHENGTEYIIDANENFAFGVGMKTDGSFESWINLREVKVNGEIVFALPPPPQGMETPTAWTGFGGMGIPEPTLRTQAMTHGMVLQNLSSLESRGVEDPSARELIERMKSQAQQRIQETESSVNPNTISVDLADNQQAQCERSPTVENVVISCQIFRCESPNRGFFIDTNYGTGSFIALDQNNQLMSIQTPQSIWNPENRSLPLAREVTPIRMGGMMGMGFGGYGSNPEMMAQMQRMERQTARELPTLFSQTSSLRSLSDPMFRSMLQGMMYLCQDEGLRDLNSGLDGLRQRIANEEMVQLVEVTQNVLTSRFINPSAIPENSCRDGDVWYRDNSYAESRNLIANSSPRTIDMATARRLFQEAQDMDDIAWDYKPDGCYARAHLMARRFEAQGIHVDKVWIKGALTPPGEQFQWNFHVAPIVYVENEDGQVEKMVIDPSITSGPVTVEEWNATMQKGTVGDTVYTSYPFPYNSANLERTSIAFSNSDPYLPWDSLDMTEQQRMSQSLDTMERYMGYSR